MTVLDYINGGRPKGVKESSQKALPGKQFTAWYLVAQEDRAINPELERFMAKPIGAKTIEVKSSHMPFLFHPNEVVQLIEAAATAAMNIKVGKP